MVSSPLTSLATCIRAQSPLTQPSQSHNPDTQILERKCFLQLQTLLTSLLPDTSLISLWQNALCSPIEGV